MFKQWVMTSQFMLIGASLCAVNMILAIIKMDVHSALGWFVAVINALTIAGYRA